MRLLQSVYGRLEALIARPESGIGTNAISQTLLTGRHAEMLGGEHLVRTHHEWFCSAAPVRDPVTGRMLAVLNVSAPVRLRPIAAGALVRTAARMTQEMMRADHAADATARGHGGRQGCESAVTIGLLGSGGPVVEVSGRREPLTPRRAEILALLASREAG